jgi:tetratricopeptide (TPR) repeat protein
MSALDFNGGLRAARTLMHMENHDGALRLYADLVKKYPQGGLWGEYARAAAVSGDFDLAERLWQQIRVRGPKSADLLSRLAIEHQQIRLHARARELYREAVALEPQNIDVNLGFAWLLARTNSVGEAREAVDACLRLDAHNERVRFLVAQLDRRENKFDAAEQQFRDLLAFPLQDAYIRYSCHAELAHIYDRQERFDEAMKELLEGKKLPPAAFKEDADGRMADEWHKRVLAQAQALPKNVLQKWSEAFPLRARKPAVALALLSGSARSGTTLLERILDAHPQLGAGDESLAFSKIVSLVDITAPSIPSPRLNYLRQRYLNMLTKTAGPISPGKVLLDKNPSRTVWLPSFLRLFPELRVLIVLRDPRDVMISLYFQNQTTTNHLTFERLANHYVNVMNIWLAVRQWEDLTWLETRYEDTVADLQKEGARVTKFLGLEWHENQAQFHENNRQKPVMSTNYGDVSKPIYQRAVGRWRVYEKYLTPVLPALEPFCREFGYAVD